MKNIFKRIQEFIKLCFIDGILTLLPISLTIGLFTWLFRTTKKLLIPIYKLEPVALQQVPHSEFFLVILAIFIIGAIFRTYIIRSFLFFTESAILKVPLINTVYSGIKQLIQAFAVPEKLTFKKVVLVEFPRSQVYSIGFLTNEAPKEIVQAVSQEPHVLVFIPTTPNPTTGFLIITKQSDITVTNLTRQEAMSLIISGGIIQPERFLKEN